MLNEHTRMGFKKDLFTSKMETLNNDRFDGVQFYYSWNVYSCKKKIENTLEIIIIWFDRLWSI